ncbi:unnamed protein product [Linum trigynum]|uniref:Retrotransposon Copia-like N-terminal domain-containing protein n=1 Tax=Linum trigynum TaxID=586398 RepID=A0AAV2ENG3_9ROSI
MSYDDETTTETKLKLTTSPSSSAGVPNFPPTFVLHNFDSPNQVFVGKLLTDSNYNEWLGDITDSFIAKNKHGFVDGSILQPAAGSLRDQWKICDAMVKGRLKLAMSKEIRSSIRFASTASDIWLDLEARFGQPSAPHLYELRGKISTLQQEKSSVSSFYTKLQGLWDEIQSTPPLVIAIAADVLVM